MPEGNLIKTFINHSIQILKKDDFKGYNTAIKKYYETYPQLLKIIYYWFYSKIHHNKLILKEV